MSLSTLGCGFRVSSGLSHYSLAVFLLLGLCPAGACERREARIFMVRHRGTIGNRGLRFPTGVAVGRAAETSILRIEMKKNNHVSERCRRQTPLALRRGDLHHHRQWAYGPPLAVAVL